MLLLSGWYLELQYKSDFENKAPWTPRLGGCSEVVSGLHWTALHCSEVVSGMGFFAAVQRHTEGQANIQAGSAVQCSAVQCSVLGQYISAV
jgi:hypothetical protein